MSKKGGKNKPGEKKVVLEKTQEKRTLNGYWITLVATVTEGGNPVANKQILFFCGNEHIGKSTTDTSGKAVCHHLLKDGLHSVTAEYDTTRSSAVPIEIGQCANDTVIRSRKIEISDPKQAEKKIQKYIVILQVLRKGEPMKGVSLRVQEQGVTRDLPPTNKDGKVKYAVTVTGPDLVSIIRLPGTPVSIWKNFFNDHHNIGGTDGTQR